MTAPAPETSPVVLPAPTPVIEVANVSKAYRPQTHQISLRHEAARVVRGRLSGNREGGSQTFWALRDLTFSVSRGEALAVVGRNGSGKTTLMRLLSGVTRPTEGSVKVRGRFATLIALGAGFNPEITGRENIYLNAAIQGVPPRQVNKFISEIIEFADLGEFIDAAVKRYSSGMVTRLGFSIAVHIFPEMIFIDEVLAVGDAAFQQQCMDRILQMKAEQRTLVFVSHAAEAVRLLCERAIWLHHGKMQMDGPTDQVLDAYQTFMATETDSRV